MARGKTQSVTLHDVAQRSGVSYQTVSRVINNHVSVADDTRARVQQAIEELRYRPSIIAKSLATRRTQLLGMIAYGTEQYGPSRIVQDVERSARSSGYEIILSSLRRFEVSEIVNAVDRLRQFQVDGLLLLTPYNASELVRHIGVQLPLVLIDATTDVAGTTVSIDQAEGSLLATQHLIDLGHRRILHVGGPAPWSDAELRYRGYLRALERNGLQPLARYHGDWSAASGFAAIQQALTDQQVFTAVVAGNDQMALGALRALRLAGVRVPEQVSVVGFDDTPESAFFEPPLTTVLQDFSLLGRKSLDELIKLIALKQPAGASHHVVFQPKLVVRGSTRQITPVQD